MGLFDNLDLESANTMKDSQTFVRFGVGTHKAEIVKTGAHKTFKTKTPLFVTDFKVLETTDPQLEVGSVVNYSDSPLQEWSLKRIRQLLVAGAGLQPGQPEDDEIIKSTDWAAAIRSATNQEKILAGATVIVTGVGVKTNAGKDYVRVSFATTPENRAKRLAAGDARKQATQAAAAPKK